MEKKHISGDTRDAESLIHLRREISDFPVLNKEEFDAVWREWHRSGRKDLMEKMVASNMGMVITFANRVLEKFSKYKNVISREDLVQEGAIGLLNAIKKYNPDLGFKILTYAGWHIRQMMERFIKDHANTIRIPIGVTEKLFKELQVVSELEDKFGREPTDEEITERLGGVRHLSGTEDARGVSVSSLDRKLKNDEGLAIDHMYDHIADARRMPTEDILASNEEERVIELMLRDFDPLDRFILVNSVLAPIFHKEKLSAARLAIAAASEFNMSRVLSRNRINQRQHSALKRFRNRRGQYERGMWKPSDAPANASELTGSYVVPKKIERKRNP